MARQSKSKRSRKSKTAQPDSDDPVLLNSIFDLPEDVSGRVVVSGSPGALIPATLASRSGANAMLFHDAGSGRQEAAIEGIKALGEIGVAAAAVSHQSCRIGDVRDLMTRGLISLATESASELDVHVGQPAADAVRALGKAGRPVRLLPEKTPFRDVVRLPNAAVSLVLVDSITQLVPEDKGMVVVSGSHGAVNSETQNAPLKVKPLLAVFNDACGGVDGAGYTRLLALDLFGTPAATIAGMSARISDARSSLDTGVISRVNNAARSAGITVGSRLRDLLETPSICDQLATLAE